ncbi:MAG: hypothetical protein Ct9H300mP16_03830 [Pseudomonadota bacterium]|nr:MAG: hypothetical protein Ct9H300mP16_03830 [Pseudomonadota bacterium]
MRPKTVTSRPRPWGTRSGRRWPGIQPAGVTGRPAFQDQCASGSNVNERLSLIQDELKSRTTQEWLEILEREEVPCAPALPGTKSSNTPRSLPAGSQGYQPPGLPDASAGPGGGTFRRHTTGGPEGAPRLGEHNRQILAELGYSEDEIDGLRDAGAIGREAYSECLNPAFKGWNCRMIDLYYWPTPNGWKISIALEEMALPYKGVRSISDAGNSSSRPSSASAPATGCRRSSIISRRAGGTLGSGGVGRHFAVSRREDRPFCTC